MKEMSHLFKPVVCGLMSIFLSCGLVHPPVVPSAFADEIDSAVVPENDSSLDGDGSANEEATFIDATFYIAYPKDSSKLPDNESDLRGYSNGISIQGALKATPELTDDPSYGTKILDWSGAAVGPCIAMAPDADRIAAAVAEELAFDPETQTVVWYVVKSLSDGWHVDGVLVDKAAVEPTPDPDPTPTPEPDPDPTPTPDPDPDPTPTPEPEPTPNPDLPNNEDVKTDSQAPASAQVVTQLSTLGAAFPEVPEPEQTASLENALLSAVTSKPLSDARGLQSEGPISRETATTMQTAAVAGVVALGGIGVGLGGVSAVSFARIRRSRKILDSLFKGAK